METRIAKTIADVVDLLADHEAVLELREGGTCTVQFPSGEKWECKSSPDEMPVRLNQDGSIYADPAGINHGRHARNVVRQLVASPEFWRKTTVADQLTRFKLRSGGDHGLVKITKKGGQPLTLHFESPGAAKKFFKSVAKVAA